MTESYSETLDVMKYYGDGNRNGAHFTFNFWFITQLNETSSAKDFKHIIDKWFAYMPVSGVPNWVVSYLIILSNNYKRNIILLQRNSIKADLRR